MNPLDTPETSPGVLPDGTKVTRLGIPRRQGPVGFPLGVGTVTLTSHLRAFTTRLFKKG